jgi:hypothetical protein
MTTTLGQLISEIFNLYEDRYDDEELAALATQVTVTELLLGNDRATRLRRPTAAAGPRTRLDGLETGSVRSAL